ncbi:TPA: di-trans,poly-cis-decaprenylcistransferase [Candidatus Woesearchaeota archaeon]|nr:di-trans,poly-cis-decaprenylcistransferase [Candidatus Woesearchaeota archaeon]
MTSAPKHIAIILDGNRRWARKQRMKAWKGHEHGVGKVKKLVEWAKELGIRELTLYAFSTENFSRPKREVEFLMGIFLREFGRLGRSPELEKHGIRIRAIGRLWMFPPKVQKALQEIMDATRKNRHYTVNFALAYGGRQEIVDAVKNIAEMVKYNDVDPKEIDEQMISRNLYLESEPDLIIRPGGERRVSNFLIWQGNYSEWFFLDKMWPEFTKNDLKKVIAEFHARQRRFGK